MSGTTLALTIDTPVLGESLSWNALESCRKEHPVGGAQTRPADLTVQDRDLMTQDQQFDVLRGVPAQPKGEQLHRTAGQRAYQ